MTARAAALLDAVRSGPGRGAVVVWTMVLLISGQGFRYLLGLPLYGVLCAVTVVAVTVAFRPTWRTVRPPLLIGAFVALAAASILWSATRAVSALAVVVLIITTYVAMVTVRGVGRARFMMLAYRAFQVSLFGGLIFELIVALVIRHPVGPLVRDLTELADLQESAPEVWSDNSLLTGGPIQGFVGNRNPFAAIALFTAILGVIMLLERRISRADGWVTLGAAAIVHVLTLSATVTVALVYCAGLLGAGLLIRRIRVPYKRVLSFAVLTATAVAAVLTIKYRGLIFGMFDRGADATHRTEIWDHVIDLAMQRPEGWGYVGYWPIWEQPYRGVIEDVGVVAAHAHNAFLDAWLQLGLIGLALLLVIVTLLFGSAWRLVERASKGDTFIPLGWAMLTGGLVLQALTESRLLVESGWYLLVALYCSGPPVFALTIVDPALVHSAAIEPEDEAAEIA